MALAIPGFTKKWDFADLLIASRPVKILLVSATDDKYSKDADSILKDAEASLNAPREKLHLWENRYHGGHAMTQERFNDILN